MDDQDSLSKDITDLLPNLAKSLPVERIVQQALSYLTSEEQELVVSKIKIGLPYTKLMQRFRIGSRSGLELIYQRTLAILRIYVGYFAAADHEKAVAALREALPASADILMRIFDGEGRNSLIADHLTRRQLAEAIERARERHASAEPASGPLIEAILQLWGHKRLGHSARRRHKPKSIAADRESRKIR